MCIRDRCIGISHRVVSWHIGIRWHHVSPVAGQWTENTLPHSGMGTDLRSGNAIANRGINAHASGSSCEAILQSSGCGRSVSAHSACCPIVISVLYLDLLNVVSGVRHKGVTCDICSMKGLRGVRWKCTVCDDFDLCHDCYMSNKHDLSHVFVRYDTAVSVG